MAGRREMGNEPLALLHALTGVTGSFVASHRSVLLKYSRRSSSVV